MGDNRSAADRICEFKTSPGTKSCYNSKLGYIITFFTSNDEFRHLVDEDGKLVLPLPFLAVKALFGQISTDPELPQNVTYLGVLRTFEFKVIQERCCVVELTVKLSSRKNRTNL